MVESFESKSNFDSAFSELKDLAQKLKKEYGEKVTDEMHVVFWAKDNTGTPCLVQGTYNHWSGDEELTMTEIADGDRPNSFLSKLDKCINKEGENVAYFYAEAVGKYIKDEYDVDDSVAELRDVLYKAGSTDVDFDALVSHLKDEGFEIEDEDNFIEECAQACGDKDHSIIVYGWEYSTVNQGNLFYGRTNHVDGPDFGEVVTLYETENIREWDGNYGAEDINEKGVRKLAEAIKKGTIEAPRY